MSENENEIISDGESSSTGELFPIEDVEMNCTVFNYSDPNLYSGITAAVLKKDINQIKALIQKGKSVRIIDNNGNTPLHIAVISFSEGSVDLIKYLLSLEDVDKNETNFLGQTPLLLAVKLSKDIAAYMLLEAGVDVQQPSNADESPLHFSVRYSCKLSEALVLAGADVNFQDYSNDTPLHDVITYGDVETMCMLLYYGADASARNTGNLTPFMQSLAISKFEHADHLFDYVSDFNLKTDLKNGDGMSTLFLAIGSRYPRIIEMIERGADVNTETGDIYNVFTLNVEIDIKDFKFMWERFEYADIWSKSLPNILIYILNNITTSREYKLDALSIILGEDNLEKINSLTEDSERYPIIHYLVNRLFLMEVPQTIVYKFCAILLSHNLVVYDTDLDMVYERYGHCDIFKLLLHMEIRSSHLKKFNILPSLIYKVDENYGFYEVLHRYLNNVYSQLHDGSMICELMDYENIFEHISFSHVKFPLRDILISVDDNQDNTRLLQYIESLPQVPKLLELARNKSRDFLCRRYKIKNSCQFYTILKQLEIPSLAKQYIAFEIPIYKDCQDSFSPDFRAKLKLIRERKICLLDRLYYNASDFKVEYPGEVMDY